MEWLQLYKARSKRLDSNDQLRAGETLKGTKKTVDPCVVYSLKPFMTFPSVSRFTNEWQPRLLRRDLSL